MSDTNNELISFSKDIPVYIKVYHYNMPNRHWHPTTELLFVLSGTAEIIIEDEKYLLVPEDVCLINSNTLHQIIANDCSMLSVSFQMDALKYIDSAQEIYFDLNSSGETSSARYDYVRHLMAQLVKVNASGENIYMSLSLLYGLISHLLDNFRGISPSNTSSSVKFRDRISGILQYIEQHYKEGVTLTELAQAQNLSVPYFASFFEKNTGMTFLTYYNTLRLNHAVSDMLSSDEPLEKIALDNGFRDSRSFVSFFKKKYHCLPSEYRKKFENTKSATAMVDPLSSTHPSVPIKEDHDEFKHLAKYLSIYEAGNTIRQAFKEISVTIDGGILDYSATGVSLSHKYKNLCCVGSARQFLYHEVQEMVRTLQQTIHYNYIKFHGILSDEMMVYMEKEDGTPVYSFTLMDKVFDFLRSVDLKPLVQLSFMPQALASDPDKQIYTWNFNTSPPKSMKKWTDLVTAVTKHLIHRYGLQEVRSWLFCVWNEPDGSIDSFGWENPLEFYDFYKATYLAIKAIDPQLSFGSPSLLINPELDPKWTMDFFEYTRLNGCESDFINIHYYDNSFSSTGNVADSFSISNIEKTCPLNVDPFAFTKFINQLKVHNKKLKLANLPIYLTEWNLTVSQRDLINDTCFKSCYLTKNLLENYDRLESFGYWCLTDFIEEFQVPNEQYHGGLGMFTYNGIPKAHYNTFEFLSHLGNELMSRGNGYFITKDAGKIVILLYNYEHYSKLFASGILFDMSNENRYAPFTQMNQAQFKIQLTQLPTNACLIKEQYVNQQQGSSFDAWAKMGYPSTMRPEDLESLKQVSKPGIQLYHQKVVGGELSLCVALEPLEVRLIEIVLG